MIRFMDIRKNGVNFRFSFFDTETNRYIDLCDNQVWNTFAEFRQDFFCGKTNIDFRDFYNITPPWAFEEEEE